MTYIFLDYLRCEDLTVRIDGIFFEAFIRENKKPFLIFLIINITFFHIFLYGDRPLTRTLSGLNDILLVLCDLSVGAADLPPPPLPYDTGVLALLIGFCKQTNISHFSCHC